LLGVLTYRSKYSVLRIVYYDGPRWKSFQGGCYVSRLSPHRLKDLPPIIHASPIPTANNVMVSSSPLANVKSIGQMIGRDRAAAGNSDSKSCGYCSYELAIAAVDLFCDDCANIHLCPSYGVLVAQRVRFAARS